MCLWGFDIYYGFSVSTNSPMGLYQLHVGSCVNKIGHSHLLSRTQGINFKQFWVGTVLGYTISIQGNFGTSMDP
jgi:hypothetical protein